MALNAKLKKHFEGQVAAGTMSKEYGDRLMATLEDAPADIQNGWMANEDYNRQANELKTKIAGWKTWETESQETLNKTAAQLAEKTAKIAELEDRIASGDLNMGDQNVLAQQVKDLKALVETKLSTIPYGVITEEVLNKRIQDATGGVLNFMGNFQDQTKEVEERHQSIFGKPWSRAENAELITFASEQAKLQNRNIPLGEAYDLKNKEKIKEQEKAVMRAELEKEYATRFGVPGAAGSGGGDSPEKGPLQAMLDRSQGKDGLPADGGLAEAKAHAANLLRGLSA